MTQDSYPNDDTDTLLALLSSLLTSQYDHAILLDALVEYGGNVQEAARHINSKSDNLKNEKKRKRPNVLQDWFKPAVPKPATSRKVRTRKDDESVASTSKLAPLASPKKPVVDLMSVLCQPPSEPKSLPRLQPLMLSTPSLVTQHTPCTLHLSVLQPELACKLFYTLIDESRSWTRNKWWLFDKLVESPHRTSFYTRKDNGVDGDQNWQEAAQYWQEI
jgi:hypothetical protein